MVQVSLHPDEESRPIRVCALLMPGASIIREARLMLSGFARLGVDLTVLQYWSDDYFPHDFLRQYQARYLTLSDRGFPSIPRLPRLDYLALSGDAADSFVLNVHSLICEEFPSSRGYLLRDSWHYQQLNMLGFRLEQLLSATRPDLVVIQGGSEVVQKLARVGCGKLGIPTLAWETPFFRDRLLLDPVGMHYFPKANKIDEDWPLVSETPLTKDARKRLRRFLEEWKEERSSKYVQESSPAALRDLERLRKARKRLAFLPGQIPWDASVITGPHGVDDFESEVTRVGDSLPPDWGLVYKVHPLHPAPTLKPGFISEGSLVVHQLSIHDIFSAADAIIVHSSNVGLEALICGRPVICLGTPHYAGKGLTLDFADPSDLAVVLERSLEFRPDPERLERFLHYLVFEYLVDANCTSALERRVAEARERPVEYTAAPFADGYPPKIQRYLQLGDRYNHLAEQNFAHHEILEKLLREGCDAEFLSDVAVQEAQLDSNALESGRRQIGRRDEEFRQDTRFRYAFARNLVTPGSRILDFGCGVGFGTAVLASLPGVSVVGLDMSGPAIEFARMHWNRPNIEYRVESAGTWQPRGEFDLTVAFETLEQMVDAKACLAKLWASLRPGGALIFSIFNHNHFPVRDNPFHIRHWTPEEARDALSSYPDCAWKHVLVQEVDGPIRSGPEACFLIGLGVKSTGSSTSATESLESRLRLLLPFQSSGSN